MIEKSPGVIRKDMQSKQALKCSFDRPRSNIIKGEPSGERSLSIYWTVTQGSGQQPSNPTRTLLKQK